MAQPELSDELIAQIGELLDKHDLLTTARLCRRWSAISRQELNSRFWRDLQLDSYERLLSFSQLRSSSSSTLHDLTFKTLTINDRPASSYVDGSDFAFLLGITITESAEIELQSASSASSPSPFPWSTLSSWVELSSLSVTATIRSPDIIASIIVSLPNLENVCLDVDYIDPLLTPYPVESGPCRLRSLQLRSRGHTILSWLTVLQTSTFSLQELAVEIACEDLRPLQEFSMKHASEVEYLTATLHRSRFKDLIPCLPYFGAVVGVELCLRYSKGSYQRWITAAALAIDAPFIESFDVYVPMLPGGLDELRMLQISVQECFSRKPLEYEGLSSEVVSISQRSWV
ncbi:hypothetical protein DFP72DRAFT_1064510 [Ephemerocybe angulata]|uniref:F-box domain-containing protein n=1 Tax=Ephemerocybe angulata TaxID=980116 RepID=A0A8H6I7Z8_9AGAR|nr:hypothetical protein DFP72DRAFT_1064510 [Tulosesus angulatus]